jgi:hypothetical protein
MLAAPVFLVGSLGYRLAGLPALWRRLRRPAPDAAIWSVLAWTVVAAFAASTFIVSVPYHETTQIHQLDLFLLAIFTGHMLASVMRPRRRMLAVAVTLALAVPSTVHYIARKWNDRQHPNASVSSQERSAAAYLRGTDPERTVLMHDLPDNPTLLGLLAERRSLLSWADYVRGSEARADDVRYFFTSARRSPDKALAILQRNHPTHVIEYKDRDQIHPEVLSRLQLVFSDREIAIYLVP